MRASVYIDLLALQHNFLQVRQLARASRIIAMIKANAYGHGAVRVAKTLIEADAFGVATIEEGIELRQNGILQPILVMSGFINREELTIILAQQLTPVIHEAYQVDIIESLSLQNQIDVWLKIDTGMHRLGFNSKQLPTIYQRLINCSWIRKPLHLLTHMAYADNKTHEFNIKQLHCFHNILAQYPGVTSIANSAGILAWPNSYVDWVRPGIMLYGISPIAETVGSDFNLRPVMTLNSRLIAIHSVSKGDAIGYNGTWICPKDTLVGVVSIGYGDGYPRHAKNGTPVLVNGIECSLIGRVSMDMITVDLEFCPQARIGDQVTLWGQGLPAERIADCAGTIAYELFCKLTKRVTFL